jgi:hypothetical protein
MTAVSAMSVLKKDKGTYYDENVWIYYNIS